MPGLRMVFLKRRPLELLPSTRVIVVLVWTLLLKLLSVQADSNTCSPCPNSTHDLALSNVTTSLEQMKPLELNIAVLLSLSNKGGGKFFGGAFFLAVDRLNEEAANRSLPVRLSWTFRDAGNKEKLALREMALLLYHQNVSVFVGPDIFCKSAGELATGFNVPYITYNCHQCKESNNQSEPMLFVNTQTSFVYIARFLAAVLHHYSWSSFWLVTGLTPKWQNVAQLLKSSVAAMNSINGEKGLSANDEYTQFNNTSSLYTETIQASKHRTRVYVFLGLYESLLLFLRELANQLPNPGEYVVLFADEGTSERSEEYFYLTPLELRRHANLSEQARLVEQQTLRASFRNVLLVRPKRTREQRPDFEQAVYARNLLPPINLARPPNSLIESKSNIPAQAYMLYDAVTFYGQAVMNLMSKPGADPENASQVIDYLRGHTHKGYQGNDIFIHSNGESEGTYVVESLVRPQNGTSKPTLQEVGRFNLTANDNIPVFDPTREADILWIDHKPPDNKPMCGFDGRMCPQEPVYVWKLAIIVVGALVFVLALVVILILGIRHYMYEQKLERLAWKIDRNDIQILNTGQFLELITPLRTAKKDSVSGPGNQLRSILMSPDQEADVISDASCVTDDVPLGVYKGINVAVRKLTRKNLELTRALKKQLQLRKELTHENINRFIGACIESPYFFMVTQFCPRKSLRDILRNEDSPLDEMFITSLVQDLIRGMCFLHDSELGFHGNLKSSNCLVDSRWTLKISDLALPALGLPDNTVFDDEGTCRDLLWTAPELLRCRRRSSNVSGSQLHHFYHGAKSNSFVHNNNIHNNNNNSSHSHNSSSKTGSGGTSRCKVVGSQKGDVYSFAIILYELYGKAGPWGRTKSSCMEIIECLLNRTTPVLRPDISGLTCDVNVVNLIQACWHDDPDLRPDFKCDIRNSFKPIQQRLLKSNIIDNMMVMMEKYANNLEAVVAERTEQLRLEKKMTDNLLLRMLPRSVAEKLKRGLRVEAEQYEQVSIYFSDIVGFTELSAESTPMEVVDLLNDLYTCFDSIIEEFDVYKVETIGDAYMVVSGLPIRNGDRHAGEIASMSLLLLEAMKQKQFRIRGSSNKLLRIRIGIHSGPCCAGVVGLKMPRYCLFGDTVNTASRLESTGEALKIHCSVECKKILDKLGGYTLVERGYTEMKGKGSLLTYFLTGEDRHQRHHRIDAYKRMGSDGRCVSSSNLDYSGKIYSISEKNPGCLNLYNGSRNSALLREPPANNRRSFNCLDSSLESSSELTAHVLQQLAHMHLAGSAPAHDFICSTLPRASHSKYHSPQMSPIAEDPLILGEGTLEKTTSFPNSHFHESHISEHEALLGGDTRCQGDRFDESCVSEGEARVCRSLLRRPARTSVWRMDSLEDDVELHENEEGVNGDVHYRNERRDSIGSETTL